MIERRRSMNKKLLGESRIILGDPGFLQIHFVLLNPRQSAIRIKVKRLIYFVVRLEFLH